MARDFTLEASLLIIRISVAAFLLVWAIDKLIDPGHGVRIFSHFYRIRDVPPEIMKVTGAVQIAIVLAFAAGLARTLTYGAVLVMHAISTASTVPHLITPWAEDSQLLFWAAVPVLAAMLGLFLLRKRDHLLSVDTWRSP
jgi:hypothetical protein